MLYAGHRNANGLNDFGGDQWAIRLRTSPRSPPSLSAPARRGFPWRRRTRRYHRRTGRITPTQTPPRRGAARNPSPHRHTATPSACHRVSAYRTGACRRSAHPPSQPARACAFRRSRGLARFTFSGRQRAHRPVACSASPIEPGAHTRQDLDHVAHQIIGCFTGIGHHDPSARGSQCRLQMLHPEARQPVPMLHNDHPGIRVRQHPAQLGPLAVESGAHLGNDPPDPGGRCSSPMTSIGRPADPNQRADHATKPVHIPPRPPNRRPRPRFSPRSTDPPAAPAPATFPPETSDTRYAD